jgi:hypothetical protein
MSRDDGEVCAGHKPPAWSASYRADSDTQRLLLLNSPTIAQWVSPTVSPRATLFGVRNEPRLDGRGLCRSGRSIFETLRFYALAAVSWWNMAFQFPFFLTHNELAQTTGGAFSLLQVASWLAR